jgi:hypothetical protein
LVGWAEFSVVVLRKQQVEHKEVRRVRPRSLPGPLEAGCAGLPGRTAEAAAVRASLLCIGPLPLRSLSMGGGGAPQKSLHYALPGWDAVADGEARCARRVPQRSPGKGVGGRRLRCRPRLWPRRSGSLGPLEPGTRSQRGGAGCGCGGCLALAVYGPPPPPSTPHPHPPPTPKLWRGRGSGAVAAAA